MKMEQILIVDDMPGNIKILGEILKDKYKIIVASNGKAATQLASEKMPDLILMDVMMPEMDGFTACQIIKSDPKTAEIPIIFITSLSDTSDIVTGFETGGVDYIVKPFNAKEVQVRINTHLHLKRLHNQLKETIGHLQDALENVQKLSGLIPMCSSCRNIRNDSGYWQGVEDYLTQNSDLMVSHTLCPGCMIKLYPDLAKKMGFMK
jgi:PleD family two-component response regulator